MSPFRQGEAGVEETKLKDGGLEPEQGSARGDNHALALPAAAVAQLKRDRES